MKNYIPHNISYLSEENNLTQNEFGDLFGLRKGVVSTYVNGKAIPKLDTIQKICAYFQISIDDFINRDLATVAVAGVGGSASEGVPSYYNNPGMVALEQQRLGGSVVNEIAILQSTIEDKNTIINMLRAEIKRLKGYDMGEVSGNAG